VLFTIFDSIIIFWKQATKDSAAFRGGGCSVFEQTKTKGHCQKEHKTPQALDENLAPISGSEILPACVKGKKI
jgi:hypothetical protein